LYPAVQTASSRLSWSPKPTERLGSNSNHALPRKPQKKHQPLRRKQRQNRQQLKRPSPKKPRQKKLPRKPLRKRLSNQPLKKRLPSLPCRIQTIRRFDHEPPCLARHGDTRDSI